MSEKDSEADIEPARLKRSIDREGNDVVATLEVKVR
jgi:hypothetical protein